MASPQNTSPGPVAWLAANRGTGGTALIVLGALLVALAVLLAGLAIMFVSLQVVRSEERTSAVLRRLVYGYNAVLTGVLLLLILTVVNVLVTLKFTGVIDATESGKFSLDDRTTKL